MLHDLYEYDVACDDDRQKPHPYSRCQSTNVIGMCAREEGEEKHRRHVGEGMACPVELCQAECYELEDVCRHRDDDGAD